MDQVPSDYRILARILKVLPSPPSERLIYGAELATLSNTSVSESRRAIEDATRRKWITTNPLRDRFALSYTGSMHAARKSHELLALDVAAYVRQSGVSCHAVADLPDRYRADKELLELALDNLHHCGAILLTKDRGTPIALEAQAALSVYDEGRSAGLTVAEVTQYVATTHITGDSNFVATSAGSATQARVEQAHSPPNQGRKQRAGFRSKIAAAVMAGVIAVVVAFFKGAESAATDAGAMAARLVANIGKEKEPKGPDAADSAPAIGGYVRDVLRAFPEFEKGDKSAMVVSEFHAVARGVWERLSSSKSDARLGEAQRLALAVYDAAYLKLDAHYAQIGENDKLPTVANQAGETYKRLAAATSGGNFSSRS